MGKSGSKVKVKVWVKVTYLWVIEKDKRIEENKAKRDKKIVPPHSEKAFKSVSDKTARYQNHLEFLGHYLKEGKVPRGLTWQTTHRLARITHHS